MSPRKLPKRWSSLWSHPAPPNTSRVQAGIHNGADNLTDDKKINQMQLLKVIRQTLSNANRPTKCAEKQNKSIC